jgi:hypothetical protein
MNSVSVLVANVVTLNPRHLKDVKGLKPDVLYTYHQTCTKDGYTYIYIDQIKRWYLKDYFKAHDIPLN